RIARRCRSPGATSSRRARSSRSTGRTASATGPAGGAPGADTAAAPGQMRVGRRLAIKLLNVTRFVLGLGSGGDPVGAVTEPLDRSMLAQLGALIEGATASFEGYGYHRALERTEGFFWKFCDDHVELVK